MPERMYHWPALYVSAFSAGWRIEAPSAAFYIFMCGRAYYINSSISYRAHRPALAVNIESKPRRNQGVKNNHASIGELIWH